MNKTSCSISFRSQEFYRGETKSRGEYLEHRGSFRSGCEVDADFGNEWFKFCFCREKWVKIEDVLLCFRML